MIAFILNGTGLCASLKPRLLCQCQAIWFMISLGSVLTQAERGSSLTVGVRTSWRGSSTFFHTTLNPTRARARERRAHHRLRQPEAGNRAQPRPRPCLPSASERRPQVCMLPLHLYAAAASILIQPANLACPEL